MQPVRLQELTLTVNNTISERTKYGVRTIKTRERGYVLAWSNAYAQWYIYSPQVIPKGATLELDANMIFVVARRRDLERILPHLRSLPLYTNSYEYSYRRK